MKSILAILLLSLTGCAYFGGEILGRSPYQRYQWHVSGPGAKTYDYQQVTKWHLHELCGDADTFGGACHIRKGSVCHIYGTMNEIAASNGFQGTPVLTHEKWHCGIGTPDGMAYDHD